MLLQGDILKILNKTSKIIQSVDTGLNIVVGLYESVINYVKYARKKMHLKIMKKLPKNYQD